MAVKLYLKEYGHQVLDNGYEVVPLTPGKKFPNFKTWRKMPEIKHDDIEGWAKNGHAKDGIGIRTKHNPFLDLDIQDDDARQFVMAVADELIGLGPERVGAAPKTGFVYRTDEPFKKVQSRAYEDPQGRKAQVEFLGDGQQFAALHRHPVTEKPYKWKNKGRNPVNTRASELPLVTREDAEVIRDAFDKWCQDRNWKRWGKKTPGKAVIVQPPQGDAVWDGRNTSKCGLTIEQVRACVEKLPNDESVEYEDEFSGDITYRNVLFAIRHETDGCEEGREIAWEWSEKNAEKHEEEEGRFYKLWGSADPGDREDVVTFRYIIRIVNEIEDQEKHELCNGHMESLAAVDEVSDLKVLIERITETKFDDLDTDQLAAALTKAYKRLIGSNLTPARARKMLRHVPSGDDVPEWSRGWVYIQHANRFYNTESGIEIGREAFDATYSRYLDGFPASQYALNMLTVKTYWMTMYKPGDEPEFRFQGKDCINTFSERLMPAMPHKRDERDRECVSIFKRHVRNILPDERESALFTSFLAYIVQTYRRPNFATVLQGIDGDGKTFFGDVMGAVLGGNVSKLDPQQFEAPHTDWAVGQILNVVEELYVAGRERFKILNKLKPFVTNNAINVHPKGFRNYTAFNTSAYLCFTNHEDALPIGDSDRRWLVLMSRFQTGEAIREFEAENRDYFKNLYGTIEGDDARPGALRKYLRNYKLHPEFKPQGRAPLTAARQKMVGHAKSDIQTMFEELIASDSHPEISADLIVPSVLKEELKSTEHFSVRKLLRDNKYTTLQKQVRVIEGDRDKQTIWVKDPKRFDSDDPSIIARNVKRFLRLRKEV